MAGHKPIFVGLVSGVFLFLRDGLFKATLEPKAHHVKRAERIEKIRKDKQEKK